MHLQYCLTKIGRLLPDMLNILTLGVTQKLDAWA